MAIIANTFLTFDAIGLREELSDIIYNISPEETPLVSMIAKEKMDSVNPEWQTDTLAAVDSGNAQLQGDDIATFDSIAATTRVGNRMQISRKTLIISGTEEAVDKAGRNSEIAYQTAKRGAELKRDIETIIFLNQAGLTGNSTTPPLIAGLPVWIKTNDDFGAGGVSSSYTSGVPTPARTDGTQRAFTEQILKDTINLVWTSGGELKLLFVGPFNKEQASGFAGIATKNFDLSGTPRPTAIIGAADVYVSDFGYLAILPSRWQRERDGFLLDSDFLAIGHLRPFERKQLATTGDADKWMLITEWTLKVRNEEALGLVADLTTS